MKSGLVNFGYRVARFICTTYLLLFPFWAVAQKQVNFRPDYSLEKAIQVAQIEDKNIFIDTYAPWCGPCKLMDLEFQDEKLAEFLNKKYINIKINMDSAYGPAVKRKYDVFFLPTLLIVDKYGNIKYASEGALNSNELLALTVNFHNQVYNPDLVSADFHPNKKEDDPKISEDSATETTQTIIEKSPPVTPSNLPPKVIESPGEKILYTQNDALQEPEYLYNLTYLKLQLQDGTHWNVAKQYLATQDNWNTERNMKFIYDFVRIPGSEMFRHLIENREAYNELFGEDNVDRSISIMINMRLYQGYPRPERNEVLEMFKILDAGIAEVATLNYMMNRYEEEESYNKFVEIASEYIEKHDPNNTSVINKLVRYSSKTDNKLSLKERINLINHAIEVQGATNYALFETLAGLYFEKRKKRKALKAIEQAIELAKPSNIDLSNLNQLKADIQSL